MKPFAEGSTWTPADLPTATGQTALVTGANSGIGWQTAAVLAGRGARVLLGCRDQARGAAALAQILAIHPQAQIQVVPLDLADLSSIRACAAQLLAEETSLQLLINNAGIMALPQRQETVDGFERQFGVNHLGHFALTGLLLPALVKGARVVTVSSQAHRGAKINFDDLQSTYYRPWTAYGQSKLANLLFAFELQRRAGGALVSVAAHPGFSTTELMHNGPGSAGPGGLLHRLSRKAIQVVGQSAEAGAWPSLYAALMPGVLGAEYFGPDGLGQVRGRPSRVLAAQPAYDPAVAAQLWDVSTQATGVEFPFNP